MKYVWLILLVAGLLQGCKQEDTVLTTQQSSTVRFLESTHQPRLMSDEAAHESLDDYPEYYTVIDHGDIYRYIATMYDDGRDLRMEIEEGDLVSIYFNAYVFTYSALTNVMPYWSNRAEVIAAMEQTAGGLNPEYWSTEPLQLRAGGNDLKGVSKSLVGCRDGDEVEVYMTYPGAYGSSIVGVVPKESPVAWLITIAGVRKQ